jgi:hypothetical protein
MSRDVAAQNPAPIILGRRGKIVRQLKDADEKRKATTGICPSVTPGLLRTGSPETRCAVSTRQFHVTIM